MAREQTSNEQLEVRSPEELPEMTPALARALLAALVDMSGANGPNEADEEAN